LTGVPAPAGAGLLLLPVYLWLWLGEGAAFGPAPIALWAAMVALLMISNVATFGWGSIRLRTSQRLVALLIVGLVGAALLSEPWATLSIAAMLYALSIPLSILSFAKVRRLRSMRGEPERPRDGDESR